MGQRIWLGWAHLAQPDQIGLPGLIGLESRPRPDPLLLSSLFLFLHSRTHWPPLRFPPARGAAAARPAAPTAAGLLFRPLPTGDASAWLPPPNPHLRPSLHCRRRSLWQTLAATARAIGAAPSSYRRPPSVLPHDAGNPPLSSPSGPPRPSSRPQHHGVPGARVIGWSGGVVLLLSPMHAGETALRSQPLHP
jgi:hypothetical protein